MTRSRHPPPGARLPSPGGIAPTLPSGRSRRARGRVTLLLPLPMPVILLAAALGLPFLTTPPGAFGAHGPHHPPWTAFVVEQVASSPETLQNPGTHALLQSWAEAGHPRASLLLGRFCLSEAPGGADFPAALRHLNRAFLLGESEAEGHLHRLRLSGEGGAASQIDLRAVLEKARQGAPRAQLQLGNLLLDGQVLDPSPHSALQWVRQAALQAHPPACYRLAFLLQNPPPGLSPDPSQAALWYSRAIELGCALSCSALADLHLLGLGVPQDFPRARELFALALERGNPAGWVGLGLLFRDGLGVDPDFSRARDCFAQALAHGCDDAELNLARFPMLGLGCERDLKAAYSLLERSAERGNRYASLAMAGFLLDGGWTVELSVPIDRARALQYLEQAAQDGHPVAHLRLARLLSEVGPESPVPTRRIAHHLAEAERLGSGDLLTEMAELVAKGRLPAAATSTARMIRSRASSSASHPPLPALRP